MSEIISIDGQTQNERQRIERILGGKREEYAWFVNTYSQQVLDFTSRMLPDAEDAREVAQDAFVKAFRSLASFGFHSSFCTWVCRIAYNESQKSAGTSGFVLSVSLRRKASRRSLSFNSFIFFLFNHL